MMPTMANKLVAFRLPEDLLKQLDEFAKFLSVHIPGVEATRTNALRTALLRGMDEIRNDLKEGRSPRRRK